MCKPLYVLLVGKLYINRIIIVLIVLITIVIVREMLLEYSGA